MVGSKQHRLAKRIRWVARVIGLLAAAVCLIMLIVSTTVDVLTEGREAIRQAEMIQGILIGVLGAIGLTGCIVSWRRAGQASAVLIAVIFRNRALLRTRAAKIDVYLDV